MEHEDYVHIYIETRELHNLCFNIEASLIKASGKMSLSLTESNEAASSGTVFQHHQNFNFSSNSLSTVSEIEEEEESSSELLEINHHLPMVPIREEIEGSYFSLDVDNDQDAVYVAVGKSESSMGALSWALNHAVNPSSTIIYLIHVFPEIKLVPSPLGMIPKSRVNPEQVASYEEQERGKRRELLQKFLNACSDSKVKADTMLIESDMVAKAILDLIPILRIKKLVLGTSKSSLRKLKSKRGSWIVDHIMQNAPETCEIKLVCEGKEVIDQMINDWLSPRSNIQSPKIRPEENVNDDDASSCLCFKI